jgi:hypothetical protein
MRLLSGLALWANITCTVRQCPHAKGPVRLFVRPKLVHRRWDYRHLTTAFNFASADHSTAISSKRNTGQSNILASLAWRWNQVRTLYLKDVISIVLNDIYLGLFLAAIRRGLGITTQPLRLPIPIANYWGADKSLARPGMKQARKHIRDARDFNIETQAVIKPPPPQPQAPKDIHAIPT